MTDLKTLFCEVCSLSVPNCTCPDIDQRLYDFVECEKKITGQNRQGKPLNRPLERMQRLMSICHFSKQEDLEQPNVEIINPAQDFRSKVLGENRRLEGEVITTNDNPVK